MASQNASMASQNASMTSWNASMASRDPSPKSTHKYVCVCVCNQMQIHINNIIIMGIVIGYGDLCLMIWVILPKKNCKKTNPIFNFT